MRFAFALARSRPRKLLTVVTKSNAQRHGMVMWDEIAAEVAREFPDVTWDKMLVDAMTMRMVLQAADASTPSWPPTCTPTSCPTWRRRWPGSLGIAPTANLNPERKFPSMFEPIHGSAFDIMGKGIANPIGTFWSGRDIRRSCRPALMTSALPAMPRFIRPTSGGPASLRQVTDARAIHAIRPRTNRPPRAFAPAAGDTWEVRATKGSAKMATWLMVLNGPNLNLRRSQNLISTARRPLMPCGRLRVARFVLAFHESNHEGALVDSHPARPRRKADAIIFNPAACSFHASVATI